MSGTRKTVRALEEITKPNVTSEEWMEDACCTDSGTHGYENAHIRAGFGEALGTLWNRHRVGDLYGMAQ